MRNKARAGLVAACVVLATGSVLAAGTADRPAPGRHDAELCVTTGTGPPGCGPAQIDLRRDGSARVRVDDLVYQLTLGQALAKLVLMHGSVEIDELYVPWAWVGHTLNFSDDERHVRYEVRVLK